MRRGVVVAVVCLLAAALSAGVAVAGQVSGYEIIEAGPFAFGDGGFAGWSCPAGRSVIAGGFEATAPVAVSAPGTPGSVWPHHTFGADESGKP